MRELCSVYISLVKSDIRSLDLSRCLASCVLNINSTSQKEIRTEKMDLLSRLVTPTGTKGCASHVALAASFVPVGVTTGTPFCPGCQTRNKRALSFVPAWQFWLGNWDNRGFPIGVNLMLCSSDETHHANQMGLRFAWFEFKCNVYSKLSSLFFLKEKLLTYGNW